MNAFCREKVDYCLSTFLKCQDWINNLQNQILKGITENCCRIFFKDIHKDFVLKLAIPLDHSDFILDHPCSAAGTY